MNLSDSLILQGTARHEGPGCISRYKLREPRYGSLLLIVSSPARPSPEGSITGAMTFRSVGGSQPPRLCRKFQKRLIRRRAILVIDPAIMGGPSTVLGTSRGHYGWREPNKAGVRSLPLLGLFSRIREHLLPINGLIATFPPRLDFVSHFSRSSLEILTPVGRFLESPLSAVVLLLGRV